MARTRRHPPTDPAQIPLDKPKRSRRKAVEELKANPAITTASQLPAQLPPPEPELEPLPRAERVPAEREPVEPSPDVAQAGFAAKVVASRKPMQAVPPGFHNVASYPETGIRVNKSTDKKVAAIQFAEDRLPDRGEKNILEALGQPDEQKFTWRADTRQWQREASDSYGANIIDATRIAEGLADGRRGRGR
jgi:uncharacterized membrane protein